MKNLSEYLIEAKAPVFDNTKEGAEDFCRYVIDSTLSDWVVNPDNTITFTNKNSRSPLVYIDCKDLATIPFTFSGMENIGLSIYGKKLKSIIPEVKGSLKNFTLMDNKDVHELDLSHVVVTDTLRIVGNTNLTSIVGPEGNNIAILDIRKNKHLEDLDLSKLNALGKVTYIERNPNCEVSDKIMNMQKQSGGSVSITMNKK